MVMIFWYFTICLRQRPAEAGTEKTFWNIVLKISHGLSKAWMVNLHQRLTERAVLFWQASELFFSRVKRNLNVKCPRKWVTISGPFRLLCTQSMRAVLFLSNLTVFRMIVSMDSLFEWSFRLLHVIFSSKLKGKWCWFKCDLTRSWVKLNGTWLNQSNHS